MAVDPLTTSTASKPLVSKKQAFGSERHGITPPNTHQAYDPDRTYTVDSEKTYSMAFAKRQAKAAAVAVQMKRDKTPPQSVDTDPRMSLEGRSLDRDRDPTSGNNKEMTQVKKKPRKAHEALKGNLPPPKLRSGPLGYEPGVERRPSIERGGTNTIEMEVSGIGSRGSSRGKENLAVQDLPSSSQTQSQATTISKENSGDRKRRKHSPAVAAVEETDTAVVAGGGLVQSMGQYSSTTKPPVPPISTERSTNPSLSAPIKCAQKKVKKSRQHSHQASSQESGYGTAGDETPSRRTSYGTTVSDMDSSMSSTGGGGRNGSPGESQLIELQPFPNPEQGLRESMAKISSEDWSAKCDGMIGIRQVAMYHPTVLQPQLHSVVLAVQKEVCVYIRE